MERYIERDTRLKEFAAKWKSGVQVEEELQQDFLNYCGQVASRKCLRMNVRGERLNDVVAEVQFGFLIAIASGKYVVTGAPVAGYISTITRNNIFNDAGKEKSKTNWADKNAREIGVKIKNGSLRPVEEEVIETETLREIFEAIGDLTPQQQESILLLAKGSSHAEICRELQITDHVLRCRIFRARKILRKVLDNG